MRPDDAIELWSGDERQLAGGLTLLRLGGRFPGGTVLHDPASSTASFRATGTRSCGGTAARYAERVTSLA